MKKKSKEDVNQIAARVVKESVGSSHTPTPWIVSGGREEDGRMVKIGTGEKGWLGVAAAFGDTPEEAEANAAFIVKAVNAHDDLIHALKMAIAWMKNQGINMDLCHAALNPLKSLKPPSRKEPDHET